MGMPWGSGSSRTAKRTSRATVNWRWWAAWPLLVVLLAPQSCATVFDQPEVQLAGIRLAGLGTTGGTVIVRLIIVNPNRYALDASRLTYDVDLATPDGDDWLDLAQGTYDRSVIVGARDTAAVEIPVEFRYSSLGSALRSLMDYGTVQYRIEGRIVLAEPITRDFPYRRVGTVSVP